MNSRDIRNLFIGFFGERGHRHVPSSSLIPPPEERSLLFTTAGMLQMKPYFMGLSTPPARRLTSVQKVFRTSDIENVGDNRHETFFEMLGNFSVGDYFKAEVIPWAWELLTAPEPKGLGLSKERLWVTIFEEDEEAFELWRSCGLPPERIIRNPEKDEHGDQLNYWFMGRVGPCGPNTEINYDFGEYEGYPQHEKPCDPQCEVPGCRRFLELWNLVFMTLFQDEDGSRRPLPQRNVDTGGGFERWPVAAMFEHGVDWRGHPKRWTVPPTIYDTDLFRPLLAKVGELSGKDYDVATEAEQRAMRVVAEHSRAATFLIADGVTPSNDGRGYVLRRLIRRAMYFGRGLTTDLSTIASTVLDQFGEFYPALIEHRAVILRTIADEERRFSDTMQRGGIELTDEIASLKAGGQTVVPGERAFYFEATLGFPMELTREIAAEAGMAVYEAGYEAESERHRAISKVEGHFEGDAVRLQTYIELGLPHTEFVGYETTRAYGQVSAILLDGTTVVRALTPSLARGHRVEVALTRSPFYPEGGGQVGDRGELVWSNAHGPGHLIVEDTQAVGEGGVIAHAGRLEAGTLSIGDEVEARVNDDLRTDTMRNHTATHILHAALRQTLGTHVRQAGSLVTPDRLRFDFTHLEALSPEQLRRVEALANKAVRENIPVNVDYQSYEEALQGGALAFFGDKYADTVRVVGVCDPVADRCFSKELCGGTHVHASGDVGAIVITQETSIGAGLRRLEAVTGRAAAERIRQQEETVGRLSALLVVPPAEIETRVLGLRSQIDELEKEVRALERRLAAGQSGDLASQAVHIGETAVLVARAGDVPGTDFLRDLGDGLKTKLGSAVILLGGIAEGKPVLLAMATPDVARRCPAGDIVRVASKEAGGGGGGRPELAQGGGTDASKLDAALAAGKKLIEEKLSAP